MPASRSASAWRGGLRGEDVLEPRVVGLADRVLGGEPDVDPLGEGVGEAGLGEGGDRGVGVVHAHEHAGTREVDARRG